MDRRDESGLRNPFFLLRKLTFGPETLRIAGARVIAIIRER